MVLLCYYQIDGQKSSTEGDQVAAGGRHTIHSHPRRSVTDGFVARKLQVSVSVFNIDHQQ